jgi:hypothetical protein
MATELPTTFENIARASDLRYGTDVVQMQV